MARRSRPRPKVKRSLEPGRKPDSTAPPLYSGQEEEQRAQALATLALLDTPPEDRFDRICRLAGEVMQAPATYISLIDRQRQWFKSACGLGDIKETPREGTFCDYAIRRSRPTLVLDATQDPLFARSPYVAEGPRVRFYLGFPLVVEGQRVGTLCALDFEPRSEVSPRQMQQFEDLARMAERELTRGADVPAVPPMDGRRSPVTLLFSRLLEPEHLFDRMPPEVVVAVVNLYLEAMIEVVHRWHGTVDDLAGGSLRIHFGAALDLADHAPHAAACAVEMQRTLGDVNLELEERGLPPLACAIGLHTGPAVVGSLGALGLWKPSLVGSAVVLAEQVLARAGGGQILASVEHVQALGQLARVRGKLQELYELEGVGDLLLGNPR